MDTTPISLNLTVAEVTDILNVLGQLPTSSNAWPLAQKIAAQLPKTEPEPAHTA